MQSKDLVPRKIKLHIIKEDSRHGEDLSFTFAAQKEKREDRIEKEDFKRLRRKSILW